ncbi:MAG: sugar transferase [bacterium]
MYVYDNLGYQLCGDDFVSPYPKLPLQYRQLAEWDDSDGRENYLKMKRLFDIVVGLAALLFILPIMAICAIAIKLDSPGPFFFFQMRTGQGGRRFKMYKLRTMVRNAEKLKEKYKHLNTQSFPDFKIAEDPRITYVGRFLRKTSLDELPQIFNVLKGDMSLVGPRPTSFHSSTYHLWHTERLEAKPGVTGLWQVLGRDEIDFDDRVRLDIVYSRNQSLKMDVKILMKTFGAVVGGRGAH